jgi:hypothetical protein
MHHSLLSRRKMFYEALRKGLSGCVKYTGGVREIITSVN